MALTANYQTGYYGLVGYRDDLEEQQREREAYIDESAEAFLDAVQILRSEDTARVYYFRGADTPEFQNIFTSYMAAPVSVVHKEMDLDEASADWVLGQIRGSHASYLYVEETDADENAIFDVVTQNESFSCGVLYRISDDGENLQLTRVSQ